MKDKYQKLLAQYPAFVSLEQFRIMCHISKRKASYILTNGIVPSTNSGKKTCQYKIAVKDIVAFLRGIDENPGRYSFPSFSSGYRWERSVFEIPTDKRFDELVKKYYDELFSECPDLLTVTDVSKALGYSTKMVGQWISAEKFFVIRKTCYLIPKSLFKDFVTGREFIMRNPKSPKHQAQLHDVLQIYNA